MVLVTDLPDPEAERAEPPVPVRDRDPDPGFDREPIESA